MSADPGGYYVATGDLEYVNDQDAVERNYVKVTAGARWCVLYNGSGPMFLYAVSPGSLTTEGWHTTPQSPTVPVYEGTNQSYSITYRWRKWRYARNTWRAPAPIPFQGLIYHPYTIDTDAARLKTALEIMLGGYDKNDFLLGLVVSRSLWRPRGRAS